MINEWYWSFEGCENFDFTRGFCDDFRSDFDFFLMFVFPLIFPILLAIVEIFKIYSKEENKEVNKEMSYPVGKDQKECPFCCEYSIDKDIEFIKREDLEFLFNSIECLMSPFYQDNHICKFNELVKKFNIKI